MQEIAPFLQHQREIALFIALSVGYAIGAVPPGTNQARLEDIEDRIEIFVRDNHEVPGVKFLAGVVSYVRDQLGLDAAAFLYEMCEGMTSNLWRDRLAIKAPRILLNLQTERLTKSLCLFSVEVLQWFETMHSKNRL